MVMAEMPQDGTNVTWFRRHWPYLFWWGDDSGNWQTIEIMNICDQKKIPKKAPNILRRD